MTHKNIKKVLYYSQTIWSNTDFYRTTGVLPFINHPELILRDISHFGQISQWDLKGSDVLIIQRPCTPDHLNLIRMAKVMGLKVIIDADDDTLNVNMMNPTYVQYEQQREVILECISIADEVWASTPAIVKSYGKGVVIPNALNDFLFDGCVTEHNDTNVVVWRGSASHEGDIYEKPDEIVDMVNKHKDLDFYFIGHRFTYLEMRCGDNFYSVGGMPITQYFNYLKQLKPRALIFPLQDNLLNRAKSNISMLESHYAGGAYFGNKTLPEQDFDFVFSLSDFDRYINKTEFLSEKHENGCEYINNNLLLSTVNQLRINSLLNI